MILNCALHVTEMDRFQSTSQIKNNVWLLVHLATSIDLIFVEVSFLHL